MPPSHRERQTVFLARCAYLVEPDTSECHECGTGTFHLVLHPLAACRWSEWLLVAYRTTTTLFDGQAAPKRVMSQLKLLSCNVKEERYFYFARMGLELRQGLEVGGKLVSLS